MVVLNQLTAAGSLLRHLSGGTAPAMPKPDPVFSSAPILKDKFLKGVSAEKMVGSATFNALASLSEKRAEELKGVLKYIDGSYGDGQDASPSVETADLPGGAEASAKLRELGSRLRQYVVDHPDAVLDILDKIRTGRPELSREQAMRLLMEEIGKNLLPYPDSASSAVAISASGAAIRQEKPSAA